MQSSRSQLDRVLALAQAGPEVEPGSQTAHKPYDMQAESAEIERRFQTIVNEFGLTGQLTTFLARRAVHLALRLERQGRYEAAMKAVGREFSPDLAAARRYEAETRRSLVRMIKELCRFLPPPDRVSAQTDVRWARYGLFGGARAVESAVIAPRASLPPRGEIKKIADGQSISLPDRV